MPDADSCTRPAPPASPVVLKPALKRLWRDAQTLQLGLDASRAVVLSGVDARHLAHLDGHAGTGPSAGDGGDGLDGRLPQVLATLAAAGALDEPARPVPGHSERERQRLLPDRLSLSLRYREPGAADAALRRRAAAGVVVLGAGRVGAHVLTLLAAAGVGRLGCVDPRPVRPADLAPGGITVDDASSRADAAVAAARRAAVRAEVQTGPLDNPTLAVVAPAGAGATPEVLTAVRRMPHLLVAVRETAAVVGPFVLPGRTPCLRCLMLTRADRDPAWPVLAAQLAASTREVDACDVTLAALAAAAAAAHALSWIDSGVEPPSCGALCEWELDGLRSRRRSFDPHPGCGCGASG